MSASPQGTGYGSWAATGQSSADATFLIPLYDPEGGFGGYLTARTSIEVAEDGQASRGPTRSSCRLAWRKPWVPPSASSVRAR